MIIALKALERFKFWLMGCAGVLLVMVFVLALLVGEKKNTAVLKNEISTASNKNSYLQQRIDNLNQALSQKSSDNETLRNAILKDPAHNSEVNSILNMIDTNSPPILVPPNNTCKPGKNILSSTPFITYKSAVDPTPEQKIEQQMWNDCYSLAKDLFITDYTDQFGQQ